MADISWLRSFQRTRPQQYQPSARADTQAGETSAQPIPTNAPSLSPRPALRSKGQSSTPDSNLTQHAHNTSPARLRHAQRGSSLFGIGAFGFGTRSAHSTSPNSMDEFDARFRYGARNRGHGFVGGDEYVAEPRAAWHNPSLLQMVETLQAELMSKRDPLTPIPVVYNSYVFSLIEGFAKASQRVEVVEEKLEEIKCLREKELEQFRAISEEWIQRESNYKAEIKRLELILAEESKDGVASVTLARHNTLVNRSESKRFEDKVKTVIHLASQDTLGHEGERKLNVQLVDRPDTAGCYHSTVATKRRKSIFEHDAKMSQIVLQQERNSYRLEKEQKQIFETQRRAHGNRAPQPHARPRVYPPPLEGTSPSSLSNGETIAEAPGRPCAPDIQGSARNNIRSRSRSLDLSAPIADDAPSVPSANYHEAGARDGSHAGGDVLRDVTRPLTEILGRSHQLESNLPPARGTEMSTPARDSGTDAIYTSLLSAGITTTASLQSSNALSLGYSFVEGDDMLLSVTASCSSVGPQSPGTSQPDLPAPHLMGLKDRRSLQTLIPTRASPSNSVLSPMLSRACDGDTEPAVVAPTPKPGLDDVGDNDIFAKDGIASGNQVEPLSPDNETAESPHRDLPPQLGALGSDDFSISVPADKPVDAKTAAICPTILSVANPTNFELSLSPMGASSLSIDGARVYPVLADSNARVAATRAVLGGSEGSDRPIHSANGPNDAW